MKRLAVRFAIVFLLVAPLYAASTMRVDFGQLSALSNRVVAGRITKIAASQDPRTGNIYSTVTMSVSQAVPQQLAGREYTFRMIGGQYNGRIQFIADYPTIEEGNNVVLFLNTDTSTVFGPTVGMGQGVFFVESSGFDGIERVMDRFGRPVLGVRDERLIRGVARKSDPATAALSDDKGRSAIRVEDFFEQVRRSRVSSPTVQGPR